MAEVFNRTQTVGGTFDPLSEGAVAVTFGDIQGPGLLVENIGVNYSQDLQRLYELGSNAVYFIAGRPAGEITLGKIASPTDVASSFMTNYGDPCSYANSDIKLTASNKWCKFVGVDPVSAQGVSYTLKQALITRLGITMASKDMLIGENIGGMFVSLEQP